MDQKIPTDAELNQQVAEKVMGIIPREGYRLENGQVFFDQRQEFFGQWYTPRYSTDPAASKALREKMWADGWMWCLEHAALCIYRASFFRDEEDGDFHYADAPTEERAIALAALAAKEPR